MIKRRKVRDGVIVNEEISIDLTSGEMPDIQELMKLGCFMTVEDRIKAIQERVKPALESNGTRRKYAADTIEGFDLVLRLLSKFEEPKTKKAVSDLIYCLQNAYQSLFRTDIKALEPDIVNGVKTAKQRRDAGISSRDIRIEVRQPEWDKWQALANAIFKRNPQKSKREICREVGAKFGVSDRTVDKRITGVGKPRKSRRKK
jgi:hypothetical protein